MNRLPLGVVLVVLSALPARAQTLPPTSAAALQRAADIREAKVRAQLERSGPQVAADAVAEPGWLIRHPGVLPLALADTRAPAAGAQLILDFYQRNDSFNPADQVQFLYGFGAQRRKGLAADLFSLLFAGGIRVALGATVTSNASTGGPPTPEQAVQRMRDGGDMYVTAAYPLLAHHTALLSSTVFLAPRMNFIFDGFGGTETVTEATEHTLNVGGEWYIELRDLQGLGKAFGFGRLGWQRVSAAFQQATHLSDNRFMVGQLAVGMVFNDLIRVSAQRFSAPPAAAGISGEALAGWHLVVQLTPQTKKKPD